MAIKSGIYAASVSITRKDFSLDTDSTVNHAEGLIENEMCTGIVLLGSTAQAPYIFLKDKKELIEKAGASKHKDNFIFGTGSNSLLENLELIKHGLNNGINKYLLMSPSYFSKIYNDDGVYKYFASLIERLPKQIFICLYNYEKLCGYKFSVQVVERLVKDFSKIIVAAKDSTGNLIDGLDIESFKIFPGTELRLLDGLISKKTHGLISAIANISSKISRKVYDDHLNKKKQTVNDLNCSIRKIMDKRSLIAGVHSFLSHEDKKYIPIIPPLSPLSVNEEKEMMNELKTLNFYPERKAA